MNASVAGASQRYGRSRRSPMDFELNLASIIDCMVVLILFVLGSATFVSIGAMDAEVAAGGAEAAEDSALALRLDIRLRKDSTIELSMSGGAQKSRPVASETQAIGAQDAAFNYDGLALRLGDLKSRYPELKLATLMAEDSVSYKEVVKSMDVIRRSVPSLSLGAF